MILRVDVVNKIATYQKRGGCIVCGNSDYQIQFTFDSEWNEYTTKTARFIWNGSHIDVTFTGDTCDAPPVYDTDELEVGVYAGDLTAIADESTVDLKTTTSAIIGCLRSILCKNVPLSEDSDRFHASEAKEAADEAKEAAKKAEEAADRADSGSSSGSGGSTIGTIGEIEFVSTEDNVITYLMKLTNGEEYTFTVINSSGSDDSDDDDDDDDNNGSGTGTNPNPDNPEPDNPEPDNPDNPNPDNPNPNPEPTYTPVSIVNFSVVPDAMGYAELVKGAKITWSVTGDVDSIVLTCPDGSTVYLTDTTTSHIDENGYVVEKENMTWTLKVIGKNGKSKTKTATLFWNYRVYCGLSDKATYTNDDFTNDLKKSILTKSKTSDFKFDPVDNQYLYFAAPKELYGANAPKFQIGEDRPSTLKYMGDIEVTKNDKTIVYFLYRSHEIFIYEWEFNFYIK